MTTTYQKIEKIAQHFSQSNGQTIFEALKSSEITGSEYISYLYDICECINYTAKTTEHYIWPERIVTITVSGAKITILHKTPSINMLRYFIIDRNSIESYDELKNPNYRTDSISEQLKCIMEIVLKNSEILDMLKNELNELKMAKNNE